MDMIGIYVLAAVAAVLAVLLVLSYIRNASLRTEKAVLESDLRHSASVLEEERARSEEALLREKAAAEDAVAREKERCTEELAREKERGAEELLREKARSEESLRQMKDAFRALSAENSEDFRKKSAESITELLKPIQDKFDEFGKSVRESSEKSHGQSVEMSVMIKQLMDQSRTVGDEAKNLANALTGYSKVQGDFGEMLLTDVLKNSGLQEGIHFFTQSVMTSDRGHEVRSDEGAAMIPDVMVMYPDDTIVIIDSKVSLRAYNAYMSAVSVEDRLKAAKAHVESVRSHVDELKRKDYASYIPDGKSKVDYNIMFVPVEGAFRLMLEEEPMLWQVAKDHGVLIVSQMTLVIVLNMIQMSWRQHSQEKHIAEVYETASDMMTQIRGWLESYVKVGDSIRAAAAEYEQSRFRLADSNQSVLKKIDKLERIGVSPKRSKARIKPGARMVMGKESVIPAALSDLVPSDGWSGEAADGAPVAVPEGIEDNNND